LASVKTQNSKLMKNLFKEFKPSSWSIDNKTAIYFMAVIITLAGVLTYQSLPKEQFPEVIFPMILVTTVYPGTSPTDMENVVTKPIESQVKSIAGVKKVKCNSIQDFSVINIEFNTDVNVAEAKQKVKDAVDRARNDLPATLPQAPFVTDIDISQTPICNVNLSGDYDMGKLKVFAEQLQDRIEGMKQITRVDLIGALDREIQVNVDLYKMQAADITMRDVESAISYENLNVSGGQLDMDNVKRNISVKGEFKNPRQLENIVVRGNSGATLLLKDIAEIKDGYKEQLSYSRLDRQNVISLNVIKRGGENLIESVDQIKTIIAEMQASTYPEGLRVTMTADQSRATRVTLHDLINTIIIGFILVTLILMFFMGTTNAIFVGMSVPLSMCIAFLLMPALGFTLNFVVLFAFLLALGIVVDDAIVVVENTHRVFDNGRVPITRAAKQAAGEVFLPVLSGTLTTLMPFFPLTFWQGIIGKFMYFMPVTMIVTLLASLVVAYIINPVFAVDFMKPHAHSDKDARKLNRGFWVTTAIMLGSGLIGYMTKNHGFGNLMVFLWLFFLLDKFILFKIIRGFQEKVWPRVQNAYVGVLAWMLKGLRPMAMFVGMIVLLIGSVYWFAVGGPKVVFFPQADPNFIFTYIELPIGTHQRQTDSVTRLVEERVFKAIGEKNPLVESVIANVAVGAGNAQDFEATDTPHKGKVTVAFVEFAKRNGVSTLPYIDKIRALVKDIPGAQITVEQEQGGPPTGKPISIEVSSDNLPLLITTSQSLRRYLDSVNIEGVEELKSDLALNLPEIQVNIDRERASREGISTGQIGSSLRGMVFGQDRPSKLRDDREEYPIQIRLKEDQRTDMNALLSQDIIYRDMNAGGMLRSVPLSALADVTYGTTYAGIRRKDGKRVVTLGSNVLSAYNPMEVVANVQAAAATFALPDGVTINYSGEQEEQAETSAFLGRSLLISILLIILILMVQFNSISRMVIIVSEIFLSVVGVLLGFTITGMDFSSIMGGIGIIALAGIVVRNGILLVEFTDIMLEEGYSLRDALLEAGRTRMTPVLLTATATMLGLVPLAIGLNMDFATLFSEFDPHIFFGGDSVAFWGPLSWTIIFGLSFATFLTLFMVPVMMMIAGNIKSLYGGSMVKKKVAPLAAATSALVAEQHIDTTHFDDEPTA
jgi:multidrug efflux pump